MSAYANKFEWGFFADAMTLTEARDRVTRIGDGWRLATNAELVQAYDYANPVATLDVIDKGKSNVPGRTWTGEDAVTNGTEPYGYQFNLWGGALFLHPASEKLPVLYVRERTA